jgi:thymidylate kinase
MVFAAMRVLNQAHYRKVEGDTDFIVSDRGWLSHLAYTDHNESVEFTDKLYNNLLAKFTELPDVILYFNVNTETALKRRQKRGSGMDVIEMKGVEFQEKVRGSFLKYIETLPFSTKVVIIDANQDVEGVRRQLDQVIELLTIGTELRKNLENSYVGESKTT